MKTGKDVRHDGYYFSDCCLAERVLIKRQMFPRCPKCLNLTIWVNTAVKPADRQKAA
jgi:hypothetical protein